MPNPRAGRQMRYIPAKIQHRDDCGEPVIACYFAVFNSPTELWPGCIEQIAPGAFSSSLGGDVRALTKALNAALNGRGGGKPGICQGSCAAEPEQVEEFLKSTK